MLRYSQDNRPLQVSTPLGKDALLLEKVTAFEGVSRLFRIDLQLLAELQTPIPFDKLLGQPMTVTVVGAGGAKRFFHGLVRRFSQGEGLAGPEGTPGFTRYRAELVPQFWLWQKRVQSRIFAGQSVKAILKTVLEGLQVDDDRVPGNLPAREYCVQYNESDFAFASRLMEEEGICYFFQHENNSHRLVLTSSPPREEPIKGVYETAAVGRGQLDRILEWEKTQELHAGEVVLWDYAFEMPQNNLGASKKTLPTVQVGTVAHPLQVGGNDQLQLFHYPGFFAKRIDGITKDGSEDPNRLQELFRENQRTAALRMEQETATALTIRGQGSCTACSAGRLLKLQGHGDGDGTYFLTEVEHEISQEGAYTSGQPVELDYRNRFQALPAALPYRPPLHTPRPRIAGTQTAVVIAKESTDLLTDKHGRVKVQFFWDRQGQDTFTGQNGQAVPNFQYWKQRKSGPATSSRWVRVAQSWAGRNWGGWHLPRLGQEVIVAFEEGDPDQPVVLGCVYNEANRPPFDLPEHAAASGIRTQTVGGQVQHFSGLAFDDTKGQELVQLHSERDLILNAENNLVLNVGGNIQTNYSGKHMEVIGAMPGLGGSGGGGEGGGGPWNWTVGSKEGPMAQAQWGYQTQMIFGEYSKEVIGLYTSVVVGNKLDLLVNPAIGLSAIQKVLDSLKAVSAGLGVVAGRNELILGPKHEFVYWPKISIMFSGKNDYTPGQAEQKALRSLCIAASLLVPADLIALGTAGSYLFNNWSTDTKHIAGAIGLGSLTLLTTAAVTGLIVAATYTFAKAEGLQKTLEAAKKATEASNLSSQAANLVTGTGLTNLVANPPVAQNPPLYKMDKHSGPMLAAYDDYQLLAKNSHLISSGVRTPAVAGIGSTISMDPNPINGLSLSNQAIGQTPKLSLNLDGITQKVGTGATQVQLQLNAGLPPAVPPEFDVQVGPPGATQAIQTMNTVDGITLQYGAAATQSTLEMESTGLTLTFGIGATKSSITMSNSGLKLSFGPPGTGASITLGSAGISIKSGPGTEVKVAPTGVTINCGKLKLTPMAYELLATTMQENILGTAVTSGAVRMIK